MNKKKFPYQETGSLSKIMSDYLGEKEELKPFYNHTPNLESFAKKIEERKQLPINRDVLVDTLKSQNIPYEISDLTQENIQKLKNENCFTVTTGHQLNLFTGPLYFIYKIVSTINLAKELKKKYPESEFIPVYWMATEDHDFEEVNHINLFNKRYELSNSKKGAVGKMKLEGVDNLFAELKEDLVNRNGVEEILNLFSLYYTSEKTYTEAAKSFVNHLFGKYGLVIVDGDDAELKRQMLKEFKSEILFRKNHLRIQTTTDHLKNLGYKAQITPRELNLFYLVDGLRERIVFDQNKYTILNSDIEFSETEILEELNNFPERFSPNAPMRCMYQEKILPNLAYFGGGGELAYWLQLKDMFDANSISFPILTLRNSVLFIDQGSGKRLSKLDLETTDLFEVTEIIIKKYLTKGSEIELDLNKQDKQVSDIFESIIEKARSIDQSLEPFVKAELQKNLKSLKYIESRLIKAEKKKEEVAVNQIKNLKEKLFPNQGLQERHDNLISIFLFYGEDVIDDLVNLLEPLDKNFTILSA